MFPGAVSFCLTLLICSSSLTTPNNQLTINDTEGESSSGSTIPYPSSIIAISPGTSETPNLFVDEVRNDYAGSAGSTQVDSTSQPTSDSSVISVSEILSTEVSTEGKEVPSGSTGSTDSTEVDSTSQPTSDSSVISVSEILSTEVSTEVSSGSTGSTDSTKVDFTSQPTSDSSITSVSEISSTEVSTEGKEECPREVEGLNVTKHSHELIVNWMNPSKNSCICNYTIQWKDITHNFTGSNNSNTEEESFVIEGLDACTTYEITVTAICEGGGKSKPVSDFVKTCTDVTGEPEHNGTLCLETEKVCLKWTVPDLSINRCELQSCTVTCEAVNIPELPAKNGTSKEFQNGSIVVNVIGLSPSTRYNCVACITYEGGFSKKSSGIFIETEPNVQVGLIVGVLTAIIIVGLLVFVFVTHRQVILVWPPKLFTRAKQATVRPQPILLKKFPAYCAQMLDTPTRLGSEYQLLATLSADISVANSSVNGQIPENRRKNRYINILPYDATRVTLDLIDGDPNSHYINASFIKGYGNDIEYIATQGPKEETCLDFWRMVFQHDVRVIVMVTNLVEQEKVKCHQYYPNFRESLSFGDMTVHCTTETNFPIHTARTLVLVKGDRRRTLSHLHFREWPDFGVPQSTDIMIQFCQTMRHHALAAELGLILVHCSAGVGRTGTLIAVDILLQHISENKKVDIFGTVFKLRKQRINMVQTEGQYKYIYKCIKDAIEDPTVVSKGTIISNSLEPIYENVGTSLNTLQYEKLPKWGNKEDEA